jgi:hypothetical protein
VATDLRVVTSAPKAWRASCAPPARRCHSCSATATNVAGRGYFVGLPGSGSRTPDPGAGRGGVDSLARVIYKVRPRASRGLLFERRTERLGGGVAGVDKRDDLAYLVSPPYGANRGSLKTKSSVRCNQA